MNTSRTVSKQYREICPTHRQLVKSGRVKCSVSLSDTPPITVDPSPNPIVNLPSAPSSPNPANQHQGSVHWGAVGEHSGVKTPADSPQERSSVINLAPPVIPPRTPNVIPPVPPPKPKPRLLSPALVEGVSALLEKIPVNTSDQHYQDTPRRLGGAGLRTGQSQRKSSTWKIPIVSSDISSLESFPLSNISPIITSPTQHPAVFSPISQVSSCLFGC